MNCGFSNLDFLKKNLLPPSMQSDLELDLTIASIGRGVATQFQNYCNREFAYGAGIQEVFGGDRPFWFARRKPVSQFTTVELRYFLADAWTNISGQPLAADFEKGYIDFGYTLGRNPIQVRVTYNGGYYFNTLDQSDPGYLQPYSPAWLAAIPTDILNNAAGIDWHKFLLPDDLLFAWLLQCKHIWRNIDKIGTDTLDSGGIKSLRFPEDWALTVESTLQPYKRYQLT